MSYRLIASGELNGKALGLFRIALGLLVTIDSLQALSDFFALYSDEGMLPLATLQAIGKGTATLSLHFACRWWPWSLLLVFLQLCCAICFTIGFRSQQSALLSALLLYSLLGRNPYVVGVEDGWIVLLLLAATFLPVGKDWAVDGRVWKTCHYEWLDWYICLGAVLSVQAAAARELLLDSAALSWLDMGPLGSFWALTTVFGIYLLHQKGNLRGGGTVLLLSQSLWLLGPGRLFLVAAIALTSLWPASERGEVCEEQGTVLSGLLASLLILQLWSLVASLGAPLPPVLRALQADRSMKIARGVFLLDRRTGQRESLADRLPARNYRVQRYLSSSSLWNNRLQWRDIATYSDRSLGVEDSRSYQIAVQPVLSSGKPASARVVSDLKTRAAPPPLLKRFPRMDRADVNKPQTKDTKSREKLSGNRS